MSGKARSPVGRFAGGVFLAACCFALVACEKEATGDCQTLCENVSELECSDSVDACVSDCQAEEADLPAECQDEWQAALACATGADWTCPEPCDPSAELCEEPRPEVVGCDAETNALARCDARDDCVIADGGLTVLDEEGRIVSYSYTTLCDQCAAPSVGGGGEACADAGDCEETCCDCADLSLTTQVCIDGVCASAAEACGVDLACGIY